MDYILGPLSGLLIFVAFGMKVLCTVAISRMERNLAALLKRLKEVQYNYTVVHERRVAVDDMRSFHERRKLEVAGEIEDLNEELEELQTEIETEEESDEEQVPLDSDASAVGAAGPSSGQRRQPDGSDAAEEIDEPAAVAREVETRSTTSGFIAAGDAIAVLPVLIESVDDLFLPDTLADRLSDLGLNIVQRIGLTKKLEARGVELSVLLKSKEYPKLRDLGNVQKLALVASTLKEAGQVVKADCQVLDLLGDKVVLRTVVGSDDDRQDASQSLEKTAREMAEAINDSVDQAIS